MNVGSLFSGIGGIELGFEQEGFHTEWFVEYEPYAKAVLRKHYPSAKIYGDITKIDFSTVPKVDILTGGFPCQDISNAGKRDGIMGSRSSLWKYYCEAIRILRPKYALIENVAALANRGLCSVLADLAQIGYDAEWYNLSASAVGALHRRERLFIIAYPNSSGYVHRQTEEQSAKGRFETQLESGSSCADISYSNGINEEWRKYGEYDKEDEWNEENRQIRLQNIGDGRTWAVEPNMGRVVNGIPNRVDRIRCLGNAVVPQCAQVFAKAIKAYENG